jgi:hypothetical protein
MGAYARAPVVPGAWSFYIFLRLSTSKREPVGESSEEGAGETARDDQSSAVFSTIPQLIEKLNRHLKGWGNYCDLGYPRQAFREINAYVRDRLRQHLRRRSQRPFRPPEGVSYYEQIQRFGLGRQ